MSRATVFVDQERFAAVLLKVEPKPRFGGSPGEQATTKTGVPQWWVQAIPADGDPVRVTVPAGERPVLQRLAQVEFRGLIVGAGPSGLWFAADAVREVQR